jgi:2'-5' RNA ligase
MIRTFIALELPAVLKSELDKVQSRFAPASPKGTNWVSGINRHLTLLFIGDVQPRQISDIEAILENELSDFPAFSFSPQGLEFFPARDPHLLWLKLSAPNNDIFKLNQKLIKELHRINLETDRKTLKLHVTLARLKAHFPLESEREIMQYPIDQEPLSFGNVCLFKSVLLPSGPQYTVLQRYNLR